MNNDISDVMAFDIKRIDWIRSVCPASSRIVDIGGNKGNVFYGYDRSKLVTVDLDVYDIPNFVRANAEALPFADKSFDVAVLGEILEHVENPDVALREAARVANKIVITVPYEHLWDVSMKPFTPFEQIQKEGVEVHADRGNPTCKQFYTEDGYRHLFHHRYFTPESLRELLASIFGNIGWSVQILQNGGMYVLGAIVNVESFTPERKNMETQKNKLTISLVTMVKNEEKNIRAMIESAIDIVDEVCVLDTGSTDMTLEIVDIMADEYPGKIWKQKEVPWKGFIDSHNDALELPSSDYVLILHADERISVGHDILLRAAQEGIPCVSAMIHEADGAGRIINRYPRPRLWKNDGTFKYYGPGTHEYLAGPDPPVNISGIVVTHSHQFRTMEDDIRRGEENVRILTEYLQSHPEDARGRFYLARTLKDLGRYAEAIDEYERYLLIPDNKFRDERWQAAYDIGICYRCLSEFGLAMEAFGRAVVIDQRRAETYLAIGEMQYADGEYELASESFETAAGMNIPADVTLFLDPTAYSVKPADWLCRARFKTQDYRRAKTDAEKAVEASIGIYDDRLTRNLYWCNLKSNRNIFMTLGPTCEPVYGGVLEKAGVHGVETTYIELSDELAARGHNVFLFCQCEKSHKYHGVYYVPWGQLSEYKAILPDVVISSRWFQPLIEAPRDAKKIMWLQDAFHPDIPKAIHAVDAVVVSSRWHHDHISKATIDRMDGKKRKIIPLGIRTKMFHAKQKIKNRVIYASSPDRGLSILGDMWPELTERIPGINLSIFYGWDCAASWRPANEVDAEKAAIFQKFAGFQNVHFTGRLKKADLYAEEMAADLCLYPCNFFETFCITGLECQAAGTPMVTTMKGALSTTLNQDFNSLIRANENGQFYRDAFIGETERLLVNDRKALDEMQNGCRKSITSLNDWAAIAERWERFIYELD